MTISHPLSAGRLANAPVVSNPLPALNAALTAKVSRFKSFIAQADSGNSILPVPIFTLGSRRPEAHRTVVSIASGIAPRAMVAFAKAPSILFQHRIALLVTSSGLCLLSVCVTGA